MRAPARTIAKKADGKWTVVASDRHGRRARATDPSYLAALRLAAFRLAQKSRKGAVA